MTAFPQMLLVLLLQSTILLSLGLLALHITHRHGPAVQTLIGRATLSAAALLVLLLPLSGRICSVWRLPTELDPVRSSAPLPPSKSVGAPLVAPSTVAAPADRLSPSALPAPSITETDDAAPEGAAKTSGAASSTPTPPALSAPRPPLWGGPLRSNLLYAVIAQAIRSKEVGSFWTVISLALLLWLAVCQWHLTRLRRTARRVTDDPTLDLLASLTPSPPALLTHPSVHSPFLAGYVRPVIFLPPAYTADFDADALRAIFVHELAHLGRRDNLWTLASRLLTALLWFQPLLWLLARKLEHISEDACDQAVLASNCPPRAYAACLLSLAERPPLAPSRRTLTTGVAPFRSSVGRRISRILTSGVTPMPAVTLRQRLSIAALTLAAALGGIFLVSSAPAQNPPDKPKSTILTAQERQYIAEQNQDLQNLKVIGLALAMYERDNHYRLPDADKWMDQLTPYLEQIDLYRRDRSVFYNPFRPGQHRYGYAFNRTCSKQTLAGFTAPDETVAVFDSVLGTRNASNTGASLRINPELDLSLGVELSPASSNYVFVDGHVKFFITSVHPSFSLDGGIPSVDGNDDSIHGTWVSGGYGAAKTALIFSFANSVEKISPWPGDTRKLIHFYGRYNAHPTDLKYIFTRVWIEGEPMYTIAPEKHLVDYALSADGQTITLKDKPTIVYRRSRIYTAHKPKGFLWY